MNGDPEVGSGTGRHGDAKFQNQVEKEYLSRVGTLSGYLRFPGRGPSPAPRVVPASLTLRHDQESALRLEVGMAIRQTARHTPSSLGKGLRVRNGKFLTDHPTRLRKTPHDDNETGQPADSADFPHRFFSPWWPRNTMKPGSCQYLRGFSGTHLEVAAAINRLRTLRMS